MEERTYIIEFNDNRKQRITVPADWKVTFGPAAVGAKTESRNGLLMPMALRFYESDTRQRAIFTGVKSFRDTSIKIEEERTHVQEKEGYMECEGKKKKTIFQAKVKEWVDPDVLNNDQLSLPGDEEMFDL